MKRIKLTKEEAAKLLTFRKDKGLERPEVGRSVGIHPSTLFNYETGVCAIPMDVWSKLEEFYGVSFNGMGEIKESKGFGKDSPKKVIVKKTPQAPTELSQSYTQSKIKNHQNIVRLLKSIDDFL
jgi:Helix-turn-helix